MTLTIHTEEDEQRQLQVTVEVAEERVEQAMRKTARKLSRDLNIPGFRRGKVPYNILVRRVGRDSLRAEAIDEMVQGVFEETMDEIEPEVYGRPTLDDLEYEPLVLKFTVPLQPEVKLGEYRELRREVEPVEITEEAVDEALEQVQVQHQTTEPVDRPAAEGDLVTFSGRAELIHIVDDELEEAVEEAEESEETETAEAYEEDDSNDEEVYDEEDDVIFDEEHLELLLDPEELYLGPEFVEHVTGMNVGDEKSFIISFPEDYRDEFLAGQEADFNITVLEVKKRELPPLDDELAKLEGDYETLAELQEALRTRLERQAEEDAKNELIEGMIDDLLEDVELSYPPAAVEAEIDDMMESFKGQVTRSGWEWDDFLKLQGQREEDLRENFEESAVERLERQLVLRQFVIDEKLTVDTEDMDAAIEERVGRFGENEELQESMRQYFSSGYGFDMISGEIIMDKVHERMQAILSGEAPDLEALEAEETAVADEEE